MKSNSRQRKNKKRDVDRPVRIPLKNRIAIIHYDCREMDPRPTPLLPDIRSIAWLIQKDHRHLNSRNKKTVRLTVALFALWDQLITTNTAKLEAIRDALLSAYSPEFSNDPSARTFPVLWDLPQTWSLIRLILMLDESLTVLRWTRSNHLISLNDTKRLRGKLVRPVRHTFIEIAATSRAFREEIKSD